VESTPIPCEQAPAKAFLLLRPADIDATSATRAHNLASPGLDQAVKDLNFAEFKRLELLIKTIMDIDQWVT
jgi:hypothetical protein